jgi:hypothetical protein
LALLALLLLLFSRKKFFSFVGKCEVEEDRPVPPVGVDAVFFSFWWEAEPDDDPKNWVISAGGRKGYRAGSMVARVVLGTRTVQRVGEEGVYKIRKGGAGRKGEEKFEEGSRVQLRC